MSAPPEKKMKPVIIIPKKVMTKEDIKELRANGFCVVEAADPSAVRFIEPPPTGGYRLQERAAIKLCRAILSDSKNTTYYRSTLIDKLAAFMVEGTALSPVKNVAPTTP
jgi:hypothetical protein